MADLTITEANISLVSGNTSFRNAAETITAGDVLYAASTSTVGVATNSDATKDTILGIALNAGSTGHPIVYALTGSVVGFGAILTVGTWYVLSATGAISPVADQTTSDYVSLVGYGLTSSNMTLEFINTGVQQA